MRDKEIPYGYQMIDGRLIENSAESNAYEEIHTRKMVESGQNVRIEKREIITPEEFVAVQAIIMK